MTFAFNQVNMATARSQPKAKSLAANQFGTLPIVYFTNAFTSIEYVFRHDDQSSTKTDLASSSKSDNNFCDWSYTPWWLCVSINICFLTWKIFLHELSDVSVFKNLPRSIGCIEWSHCLSNCSTTSSWCAIHNSNSTAQSNCNRTTCWRLYNRVRNFELFDGVFQNQ